MGSDTHGPSEVVLVSFGGPESLDAIEPYLERLFSDRRILRVPFRRWLARRIARRRAPRVRPKYEALGGGSPLNETTRAQAARLEQELTARGRPATVHPAFLHAPPFVEDVTAQAVAAAGAAHEVLVLPMLPQAFSSGIGTLQDRIGATGVAIVHDFHDDAGFTAFHAARVMRELIQIGDQRPGVLFAAHAIPARWHRRGDPYVGQIEAGARAVMARLDRDDVAWCVGYHSRLGPVRWVGPTLEEAIEEGLSEVARLIVVPLSFVGEHLETRIDLDRELADTVKERWPRVRLARTPAPTLEDDWVRFLADRVLAEEACA